MGQGSGIASLVTINQYSTENGRNTRQLTPSPLIARLWAIARRHRQAAIAEGTISDRQGHVKVGARHC